MKASSRKLDDGDIQEIYAISNLNRCKDVAIEKINKSRVPNKKSIYSIEKATKIEDVWSNFTNFVFKGQGEGVI